MNIKLADNPIEQTREGLKVRLEGVSQLSLTCPEAQRFASNAAKEGGYVNYGLNKFVLDSTYKEGAYPVSGYWLMLPRDWNTNVVKV